MILLILTTLLFLLNSMFINLPGNFVRFLNDNSYTTRDVLLVIITTLLFSVSVTASQPSIKYKGQPNVI
jgi:hypothetical protein